MAILKMPSTSAVLDDNPFYGDLAVNPATTTGLTFGYTAGIFVDDKDTSSTTISASTVALTDDATNIVYDNDGTIGVAVSGAEPLEVRRLYEVVTASGSITTITDLRGGLN